MPKLRYIGLKVDGERAFIERTKICWMPGDEHDVSVEHAKLMLPHTDVWEPVIEEAKAPAGLADTRPAKSKGKADA